MDTKEISEIVNFIGANADDDYLLQPENHIEKYRTDLPELAGLLDSSRIKHIVKEFGMYDEDANEAQSKFKKFSFWARVSTFLAAAFSATLIMSGTLNGVEYIQDSLPGLPQTILSVSTVLTILFSGITSALIMIIKSQKLLENWMGKRAAAEELRLQYFEDLVDRQEKAPSARSGIMVLEYFRRFQLEVQIAYYKVRSRQLEVKFNRFTVIIAVLAGSVIIINGITGFLGLEWAFLATLGIIVQAYSAMVSNRELTEQNERNTVRYAGLRKQLSMLKSRIDEVRNGIREGKNDLLKKYVKAIHEPMAAEHRQWLETMTLSSSAVKELETELSKIHPEEEEQV